jgi:hypothetical protein
MTQSRDTENYLVIPGQVSLWTNSRSWRCRYLSHTCGYFHMFAPHCDKNTFSYSFGEQTEDSTNQSQAKEQPSLQRWDMKNVHPASSPQYPCTQLSFQPLHYILLIYNSHHGISCKYTLCSSPLVRFSNDHVMIYTMFHLILKRAVSGLWRSLLPQCIWQS